MEETFVTRGIVLSRERWRETDTLVRLYTSDAGKLELIARGTAKPVSKLAGHLEPYNLIAAMIVKGRRYDYIGAAKSLACRPGLKTDLSKLACAAEGIALFGRLTGTGQRDAGLFDLLAAFTEALNSGIEADSRVCLNFFILKFMCLAGYRPELDRCVVCRKEMPSGPYYFGAKQGGIVCGACQNGSGEALAPEIIAFLRQTLREPWPKLIITREIRGLNGIIGPLIRNFFNYHAGY